MGIQKRELIDAGFKIKQWDVHPIIETEEEWISALNKIYGLRIPGWWHYQKEYEKYKICTKEKFDKALKDQVDNKRETEYSPEGVFRLLINR